MPYIFYGFIQVSLTNTVFSQYENGSPSLKKSYFKRQRKSTKNSLSTYVETLVYSRRKSCVKRKLNFDDGSDDVVSKIKPSKSCWVMLVVVRMNEMLGYACGCVAVGGRITDSVIICFLFELIFTKYYVSMYCKGSM
ncbi:hypothetical protein QL285_071067 [Trifolium repens]|nr:hypothetical protein QL285_071067 [Trifolium repens]